MGHLRALDGLRGAAILGVLAYHSRLVPGGFVGVDLFFALSGFLITSLLLDERARHGDVHLLGFWARRFLRLVPALVAAVALAAFASSRLGLPLPRSWIAATLVYASNLLIGYGGVYPLGLLSHTWSLGMEEQFYLLWPPLLVASARRGVGGVAVAAAVLAGVPALLRLAYAAAHPADPNAWLRIYFAPDMRFDAIAFGCLAAAALRLAPMRGRAGDAGLALATLGGMAWLALVTVGAQIGTLVAFPMLFSVTSIAATAVVVGAVRLGPVARALSFAPLVWLGKISYGLYLFHVMVFALLSTSPLWVQWSAAIALAGASYWLWERPFLRLKRRFARDPIVERAVAAA